MTLDILTNAGEEYMVKNGLDTATITVGLYLDATDTIADGDLDPTTQITTEPDDTGAYGRATVALSAAETSPGQWGAENDSAITFDFTDVSGGSQDVDGAFMLINFTSTAGGGAGDWIVATGALSQTRDIHSVDTIDIDVGELEINQD